MCAHVCMHMCAWVMCACVRMFGHVCGCLRLRTCARVCPLVSCSAAAAAAAAAWVPAQCLRNALWSGCAVLDRVRGRPAPKGWLRVRVGT